MLIKNIFIENSKTASDIRVKDGIQVNQPFLHL